LPARFDQNFGSAFDFHRVSSKIKNRFGFIFRGDDKLIKRARKSLERKSEIFLDKILDSVKSHETNDFYDFSGFRLDARKRRLWRGGEVVALTPKEFEVLFFLVKRAGQVVEKEELLNAIWTDVYVEETTLARNVSWLRQKLGAANGDAKLIETVPKRGYRFLPEVTRSENAPVLRVEEKIVQRIVIEETITLDEAEAIPASNDLSFAESDAATPKLLNPQPEINNPKSFRLSLAFAFVALAAIGFAVYQYFSYKSVPKVIVAARPAPFSGLPGRENYPAFSPDGKLLAYVWNGGAGENFDVYVKQIGTGAPVRLTDTAADEIHPAFSPDGSHVAFLRTFPDHSEVFLVSTLGGVERKICDLKATRSRLSFSPDGRFLTANDSDPANPREGVFLIETETGAKRRLTTPPEFAKDISAIFSPDGKSIAFLRNFGDVTDELFVVPSGGDAPERQLTFDKTTIVGLTWSADGEKIIFSERTAALVASLRQISINGGASELIATGGNSINPAVSADGKTLAYVEESYRTSIWKLENKTPAQKIIESSRDDHSPNFSPNDSQIVFVSNRTGNQEIWIANADGKNQRQLTDSSKFADKNSPSTNTSPDTLGSPRFSPDGKFVAFDAQINGNSDIFIISAGGGAARRLTLDASREILPAWSADGQWIYFNSNRGGGPNIWKMPATGGELIQITRQGGFESFAAPDGRTIFFTKSQNSVGLWQISVDGDTESPIAELSEAAYWRYWTMTKSGIYFVARAEQPPYKIKFYDFSNAQIKEVAVTDMVPIWTYTGLSAVANGESILYVQSNQNASSIVLAELPENSN